MADVNFEVKQEGLAVVRNTVIEANFEECKAALTEMMKPYASLVVTEDGISAAKNDRARIRKVANGIEEMRKTVKRTYSEPLKAFEDKCKELVAICDEGAGNLDGQIKAFEQREADEKIARIRKFYDGSDATDEEREYCPWETVFNPKWANKGYSEDDAHGEILDALARAREDVAVIRSLDAEDVPYLLDYYKLTNNISATIRKSTELKARREAESERRQETAVEPPKAEVKVEKPVENHAVYAMEEECRAVDFRVWATQSQLQALKAFLNSAGIKYGRVP